MKRYLLPHRVWARIPVWLSLFCVLYAVLLTLISLIADALDSPPPDAMFWLSAGVDVAYRGVVLSPPALLCVWLATIFCPHRTPRSWADYIALGAASLPSLPGARLCTVSLVPGEGSCEKQGVINSLLVASSSQ
ncbi:MAG: hypothetical protein Q4F40_00535 [Akkermansia sp.]|nr:hypothetical protein [Akkermansia sp.]